MRWQYLRVESQDQVRDERRANWKLTVPGMVECPQCHEFKMPHRVCKACGYYNGKEVIKVSKRD